MSKPMSPWMVLTSGFCGGAVAYVASSYLLIFLPLSLLLIGVFFTVREYNESIAIAASNRFLMLEKQANTYDEFIKDEDRKLEEQFKALQQAEDAANNPEPPKIPETQPKVLENHIQVLKNQALSRIKSSREKICLDPKLSSKSVLETRHLHSTVRDVVIEGPFTSTVTRRSGKRILTIQGPPSQVRRLETRIENEVLFIRYPKKADGSRRKNQIYIHVEISSPSIRTISLSQGKSIVYGDFPGLILKAQQAEMHFEGDVGYLVAEATSSLFVVETANVGTIDITGENCDLHLRAWVLTGQIQGRNKLFIYGNTHEQIAGRPSEMFLLP